MHPKIKVHATEETFEELANKFIEWARKQKTCPPTFVMVDPYGVKGVRLQTIKELLEFDRVEVLLTFMVRDPARFLKEENYEEPLTALFGGEAWKACEDAEDRAECLKRQFRDVVTSDITKYAVPFRVYEDERKTVLYYLIHLTNNDLGMREMKEAMVKKTGEMTFFPITLRPTDQLVFDVAEKAPYLTLQAWLRRKYAGQSMTFVDLLNDDYLEGHEWVEKHYRSAIKVMENEDPPTVEIVRRKPKTPTGKVATSLKHPDTVVFPS